MAAYRRVHDSHHVQADCQEPGSVPEAYALGNRVWASFFTPDVHPTVNCAISVVASPLIKF